MTPFDLIFILVFLATVTLIGGFALAALKRQRAVAVRRMRILAAGLAAYMGIVLLVGMATPRREIALGQLQCSDDWCIMVANAALSNSSANESRIDVEFEISSRARRVSQRERFVTVYLRDSDGRRYDPAPADLQPAFDSMLAPGQRISTRRTFIVPGNVHELGVVIAREGDLAFPRCCIIGDGPLHKLPVTRLHL